MQKTRCIRLRADALLHVVGFRKGLFAPSTCQGEDDEKENKRKRKKDAPAKKGEDDQADEGDVEEAHGHQADGGQEGEVRLRKEKCACDEEEGRWHFRAEGPVASVGIAVDLSGG